MSNTESACVPPPGQCPGWKARVIVVFCCLSILIGSNLCWLHAQKVQDTGRKLIYKAVPAYPEVLKRKHIGGIVRLNIVISRRGAVDKVSPVGGNPILVDAAAKAVRKWKYAPADSVTKVDIEFVFDPQQ